MTLSYTYEGTVYYCKYSAGNLISTTVAPASASSAELNNYYFVLKATQSSRGVATLTQGDNAANYYIYSPNNQAYLTAEATSSNTVPTFSTSIDNGKMFSFEGPRTAITFVETPNVGFLYGLSDGVYGRKSVATMNATTFDVGTVLSRTTDEGAVYDKITSLTDIVDGDTLALVGIKSDAPEGYTIGAMSTTQNANNRGTVFSSIDEDNRLVYVSNLAKLTVNIDANGYYTFYDPANNGYLYSAGTASTGRNYLRTNSDPDSFGTNWGRWTISLDSDDYEAHILSVGNASTPYLRYNASSNGTAYYTFSCYGNESVNTTHTPLIFKKNATSGAPQLYSNAVVITFASQSAGNKTVYTFDLHTTPNSVSNPDNPNFYSSSAFAVQRTDSVAVTFNKTLSKVSYTATAINRWQKVTATSELSVGDSIILLHEYTTATAMSTTQADNNRGQVASITLNTSGTPYYIENADLPTTVQQITLSAGTTGSCMSLNVGDAYLYAASSTSNYLRTQTTQNANSDASITITGGDASIIFQGNSTHNILQYNASSSIFSCYSSASQQTVQIYKHIISSTDTTTYIGDLVGNRYDPERVDVVGPATYTSSYIEMSGSIDTFPTLTSSDIGAKYYTTSYAKNAITILVDVTGSRDLGTLFYTYNASSTSIPEFATGDANNPISLSSAGARDVDTNGNDSVHTYLLNLNTSNIARLSFCALDSSGNICAIYSSTGTLLYSSEGFTTATIAKYVIEIGNTTGTIQISDVQYTYNNADGNVGNFGSVDYRSASYDTTGNFTGTSGQISSSNISIYYTVSNSGQLVSITVSYDATSHTYTVTITSSVNMTVNIFNYDPTVYSLVVNGTSYFEGTNIVTVTAS